MVFRKKIKAFSAAAHLYGNFKCSFIFEAAVHLYLKQLRKKLHSEKSVMLFQKIVVLYLMIFILNY